MDPAGSVRFGEIHHLVCLLAAAHAGAAELFLFEGHASISDRGLVKGAADEILVLKEGKIVERGTHEQLVSAGGVYTELYETQFKPRGIADHT